MRFEDVYRITRHAPGLSAAQALSADVTAAPGVYDSGLISVVDEDLGTRLLDAWTWYLGPGITSLLYTWDGNVIFWSERHGSTFYFNTQASKTTFIDKDIGNTFDKFLVKDDIKEKVLFQKMFLDINIRLRDLNYCECYIARPWAILGGSEDISSFDKGDCEVYLSLVGQTVQKVKGKR